MATLGAYDRSAALQRAARRDCFAARRGGWGGAPHSGAAGARLPHGTSLASDDAKMPDDTAADMPDLTLRELKTEMDGRFQELKASIDSRFDEVETRFETRLREEHVETRRHFDVVAESLTAEIRLGFEGTDARLDNHERRIQALEKRRR
jgi:hypothetical protein